MADASTDKGSEGGLPPKLDLKKSVLKPAPGSIPKPVAAKPAPILKPVPASDAASPVKPASAVKPAAAKPAVAKPAVAEPVAIKPAAMKPAAAKPVAAKPVGIKPAAVKPVAAKPVGIKPAAVKPVAAKPVGIKPAAVKPVAAKPAAMKPAAVKPVAAKPAPLAQPAESKKETSKISLDMAKPAPGGAAPKTIRIKPVAAAGAAKPAPAAPVSPAATALIDGLDDKKKTSRISLDAAFTSDAEDKGTKTIKIKKPASAPTVQGGGPTIKAAIDDLSQTAQLAQLAEEEEETPAAAKKKTIKVKRPGAKTKAPKTVATVKKSKAKVQPTAATVKVAAPPADAPAPVPVPAGMPMPQAVKPAGTHWVFPTFGTFAVIILLLTVYLFCTQAIGPNLSLTQLSWWPEGPELPCPGKRPSYME